MVLVFPNGEHGPLQLKPGVSRIGSAADSAAALTQPGVLPLHCEIHLNTAGANLQVPTGGVVSVNGKPVVGLMALRAGDTLQIGPVLAKLSVEAARSAASSAASPDEDAGATRVRVALPKYILRGLSGAVFGKVFPVAGPVVIGRAAECDISVPADEISRRHALVKPTANGLTVEDLASANGTYINGKRIQQGFLNPGDELRLDAVRFILVAPGMEMATQMPKLPTSAPAAGLGTGTMQKWLPIVLTMVALIVIMLLVFGV